ncbi:ADP-ribosylation factor like protein 2b [Spironucleus salmonicida]|uniref:ADP-ribosylation factor n=1 Tax=Spironucleus salmonicida TaxID=348837 RepID=V6LXN4_9EUKA|nr:ADP-ribosylation factor like protein 2b [Spironucleus salmonicida]|eukprot:EST45579.1 ADP-ribosylation factor [Spironucleus salmonicida]
MPNVLIIGLDNAGKSTLTSRMLTRLGQNHNQQILPTIALETHTFKYRKNKFTIFDLGGSGRFRSLWESYVIDANIILVVIDSADRETFFVARDNFQKLMSNIQPKQQQFKIIFNKQDLETAVTQDKMSRLLNLDGLFKGADLQVFSLSALRDEGVEQLIKSVFND